MSVLSKTKISLLFISAMTKKLLKIILLVVFSCWFSFVCSDLSELNTVNEEQHLGVEMQREPYGSLFLLTEESGTYGGYWDYTGSGRLVKFTDNGVCKISEGVSSVTCTDSGVAYTADKFLFIADEENDLCKVADDVSLFCWNGEILIYLSEGDNGVYACSNGEKVLLFEIGSDADTYRRIIANEDAVVLLGTEKHLWFSFDDCSVNYF